MAGSDGSPPPTARDTLVLIAFRFIIGIGMILLLNILVIGWVEIKRGGLDTGH